MDEDLAMALASSSTKVNKFGIHSFGVDGGRPLTVGMDDGVEDTAGAGWTLLPVIPDDFEGEAIVVEARSATSDTCKGEEDLSSDTGRMVELRRRFADDAARRGGSRAVNASTSSSVWGGMVEAAICFPFS